MNPTPENPLSGYDFASYPEPNNESDALMKTVTDSMLSNIEDDDSSEMSLREQIHRTLVRIVDPGKLKQLSHQEVEKEIRTLVEKLVDDAQPRLSTSERSRLINDLLDDILGYGPLEKLLRDDSISDILVNGAKQVYIERNGVLIESDIRFRDDNQLLHVIQRIVGKVGRRVDERTPLVDARLADGSRVNAIIPPLAHRGPTLSIRRFGKTALRIEDLQERQMFTQEMLSFLDAAVKAKFNILISGGTGSGKTTLLNTLSSLISHDERIVTIEDSIELQLQQKHVVQLESRPPNIEGLGEITIRELMRNSLRMRPDRIVIGECRGPEALDMMQAMNTGHEGSMTTLHANSPHDALSRLENMVEMSGVTIPVRSLREQIASSINLVIQTDRLTGGVRRITSITEVIGMEGDVILTQDLFRFVQHGIDEEGKAYGIYRAEGILPHRIDQIRASGTNLDPSFFIERELEWA